MASEILVVGAGPVGLTLAAELARFGVRARLVDKASGRSTTSKALVVWSRTLELIDRMGCGATFLAAGHRVTGARIVAGGREIARVGLSEAATPHPYALMLPQSETERLLEGQLVRCGGEVERGVELRGFAARPDGVTATLVHADGREEQVEAGWLIGCDGAHSAVRHGLGRPFVGEAVPSDWMLADIHLSGLADPSELLTYWHADGVLALFPITPGRWRIIADLGKTVPGTVVQTPTLDQIQRVLDQRGPAGVVASDPIWLSGFRINERKVADYRVGRVFLAGDAAHIHSPAGGQGMNTGMQDAFNLAWKLALRHRAGGEALLASYSAERSPVGDQVLAAAGRMTSVALLRGEVAQALRNRVAGLLLGLSPLRRRMVDTLTELSIGYPDSPLNAGDLHAGPRPGERAPVRPTEPPVGTGHSPRFALFADAGKPVDDLIARHRTMLEPAVRPAFEAGGHWLVRPDGYVAVATRAPGEIDAWLDRLQPV